MDCRIFACLAVLSGCALQPEMWRDLSEVDELTLCRWTSKSRGQPQSNIHFRSQYHTDFQSYSYFLDGGCGMDGVLHLLAPSDSGDGSWVVFEQHQKKVCAERKAKLLCAYSAVVDVDADLVVRDGKRFASIRSIKLVNDRGTKDD